MGEVNRHCAHASNFVLFSGTLGTDGMSSYCPFPFSFPCNVFSNNLQSTPWAADGVGWGGLVYFFLSIFGSILRVIVRVHMDAPYWVSVSTEFIVQLRMV